MTRKEIFEEIKRLLNEETLGWKNADVVKLLYDVDDEVQGLLESYGENTDRL